MNYSHKTAETKQMSIEDITVGEAQKIAALISHPGCVLSDWQSSANHPLEGQRVVAVLTNGFIHFGILNAVSIGYRLTNASNLRRWSKRNHGLPEFASKGPIEGDMIDPIGEVYFDSALFFYPCGEW